MNTIVLPIHLSYARANLSVKATVKYGVSRFPGEKEAFFLGRLKAIGLVISPTFICLSLKER